MKTDINRNINEDETCYQKFQSFLFMSEAHATPEMY